MHISIQILCKSTSSSPISVIPPETDLTDLERHTPLCRNCAELIDRIVVTVLAQILAKLQNISAALMFSSVFHTVVW